MSEPIKHECGIALIRLRKPLEYYTAKYGSLYALNKMYLLMEKQHNRGQDGAGLAIIKKDVVPGQKYIHIRRSNSLSPIKDIFTELYDTINAKIDGHEEYLRDADWMKKNVRSFGELYLGHLRYGTFGKNQIESCHPFIRTNNWMSRTLVMAGNFNLTNVDELFNQLVLLGQHPKETTDTVTMLEKIGHFLDEENDRLFTRFKKQGFPNKEISNLIAENLNVQRVLSKSSKKWDGGFVIAGLIGHGDAFVMRDPSGIRPAYYYIDEEIVVVTSERPVIQTAFNVPYEKIHELKPAHSLIIKRNGQTKEVQYIKPRAKKSCSFERIYFSRGTDAEIYKERKRLGSSLSKVILKSIDYDLPHTVFSYIPNTASVAFRGLMEEIDHFCDDVKMDKIKQLGPKPSSQELEAIFNIKPRIEKVAVKDVKLRTFITEDLHRNDLVSHVYDITYKTVCHGEDNLVVIDDSIVRGTTLKQSIIKILDRLGPKKIIVASSAPQIRYPDCYGIDMAKLSDFIAFQAAIQLLKETKQEYVINEVYKDCKAQIQLPKEDVVNHVKRIYKPFTAEQVSAKISQLLTPPDVNAQVEIVFQSIESLHRSCPDHTGDWYFTGDYPTPGGNKVVNQSFINFIEGRNERAY